MSAWRRGWALVLTFLGVLHLTGFGVMMWAIWTLWATPGNSKYEVPFNCTLGICWGVVLVVTLSVCCYVFDTARAVGSRWQEHA